MPRLRSAIVVPVALLLALAPASLAHAERSVSSEGSVPSEVTAYVSDGSLVAQLNDVYGVDADGDGIEFDDTTKPGVIERVHVWSDALRAGEETDHPVDILNEWIVPITIADAPVGLATVWINPASVRPELAGFVPDADLATALSAVPDGASLVHDVESAAWLALAADGTLTPLVPGSTGLSTPVPLDDVAILPASGGAEVSTGDPGTGVGFAIAVLLLLLAVIIVALIVPGLRARRKTDAEPATEDDAEPAAVEPPALEPVVAPKEIEAAAADEPEAPADEPVAKPVKKVTRKPKATPPED